MEALVAVLATILVIIAWVMTIVLAYYAGKQKDGE